MVIRYIAYNHAQYTDDKTVKKQTAKSYRVLYCTCINSHAELRTWI